MSEETPLTLHDKNRTVHALLLSSSSEDQKEADVFLRKLWALLVFQYGTILFVASPFALIDPFRKIIEPYHHVLEGVAFSGIFLSLCLAIKKGASHPLASHVALASLTVFVALEMGLTFANASWGPSGLVALGQATTSFAVVLSVLQFESLWLTYPTAALLCLCLSGLWTVVQAEIGVSWTIAAAVSLGGWAFTLMVLMCCSIITKHVKQDEYILAVLFILVPEAILFLPGKKQHPNEMKTETNSTIEQQYEYGGV